MKLWIAMGALASAMVFGLGCGDDGGNSGDGDGDAGTDGSLACGDEVVPADQISMSYGIAIAGDGTIYYTKNTAPTGVGRWQPGGAPEDDYVSLPDNSLVRGLALAADGTLFVAALDSQKLYQIDTTAASPAAVPRVSAAGAVEGVAIGPDGAVYFSDPMAGTISRSTGVDQSEAVTEEALASANALAFDEGGDLLVATRNPGQLWRLTLSAGIEASRDMIVDLSTSGAFLDGVGVDEQGRLYTSDSTNGKLLRLDPSNGNTEDLLTSLASPANLAFSRGTIECGVYVATPGGGLGFHAEDVTGSP